MTTGNNTYRNRFMKVILLCIALVLNVRISFSQVQYEIDSVELISLNTKNFHFRQKDILSLEEHLLLRGPCIRITGNIANVGENDAIIWAIDKETDKSIIRLKFYIETENNNKTILLPYTPFCYVPASYLPVIDTIIEGRKCVCCFIRKNEKINHILESHYLGESSISRLKSNTNTILCRIHNFIENKRLEKISIKSIPNIKVLCEINNSLNEYPNNIQNNL